jgi:thiamine-phosphate pyrophosphorylase
VDEVTQVFAQSFAPVERGRCSLYLISPQEVAGTFPDRLKAALEPGLAAAFQLRVKGAGEDDLARLAEPLQRICAEAGAAFIVNDSIELARRIGADGVHLGQLDGDIREARALLGPSAQIGKTCHDSRHLAMEAGEAGADYVAFGAFYPTGQCKAADRRRRRLPRRLPGHMGQRGSPGRGSRLRRSSRRLSEAPGIRAAYFR